MYIGTMAFKDCARLETITLPASLTQIAYEDYSYAFSNCPNLTTISNNSSIPIAIGESTFDAQTYINTVLKVPENAKDSYQTFDVWKNFFHIEEDKSIKDDVRSFTINSYRGGVVECLGYTIGGQSGNSEISVSAKLGEAINILLKPDNGYRVYSVLVNDHDVTSQIQNNELSIIIEGNTTVTVEFDESPIYLTIKYAENGTIKQEVSPWSTYSFLIEPSEGWKLHTVMYNGVDITSKLGMDGTLRLKDIEEDSFLSITFETNNTSINDVYSSKARIYGSDGKIVVVNTEVGESIQVFNDAGVNVVTRRAIGTIESIIVDKGHVYIVKLKGKTVKLAI